MGVYSMPIAMGAHHHHRCIFAYALLARHSNRVQGDTQDVCRVLGFHLLKHKVEQLLESQAQKQTFVP
uniref:Uncharacterized protein n=1 Tax=Glossina pallidipes TaxID=7398 RepID=A0A1A9ZAT7_GLOPL